MMERNKIKCKMKKITYAILSLVLAVSAVSSTVLITHGSTDQDSALPAQFASSLVQATTTSSKKVIIKTQEAANSLIAQGATLGIDVSKWQGAINWQKVAQDSKNIKFAFIRSNYGSEIDPNFVINVRDAQTHGIKAGAYHYARFKTEAEVKTEANAFLNQLKQVNLDYPVVLDVENHYSLSKASLTTLCNSFIDILEGKGYSVVIYTYNNFYKQKLDATALKDNHIWIANYIEHPADISHTVWQHTSYGTVSGISGRVDINLAYQDLSVKQGSSVAVRNTAITPTQATGLDNSGVVPATTQAKAPAAEPAQAVIVKPIPSGTDLKLSPDAHKYIVDDLNKTLDSTLPTDSIDLVGINKCLARGIQKELIVNFNKELTEQDALTEADINTIITLTGAQISDKNITKYIQVELFYLGYYSGEPSGRFDSDTNEAIKAFQEKNGITSNGVLNKSTLKRLFAVA